MSRFSSLCRRTAAMGLLIAGALSAAEPGFQEVGRLAATQPKQGDVFGAAVAVGGGVIAVGAYLSDSAGKDSGAVYLFHEVEGTWTPFGGMPLHGDAGEWFGFDVAIDPAGKILVVGAPGSGKGTGAVYLFDLDGGQGTATNRTRLAATVSSGDEFGSAVAIDGSYLAVGARGANQRAGKLHLFSGQGRSRAPVELPGLPSVAGAELGQSVSVRGNTLVVGAPLPGRDGKSPGAAYRLDLGTRTWEPLIPAGLEAGAAFGYSVSVVDGQRGDVVVGAPLANSQAGAVYRYPSANGQPFRVGSRRDQAGVAVAASGGWIVAGARNADGSRGAADLFNSQGSFIQPLTVSSSPLLPGSELGFSVAIHDRTIVVGAFKEGGKGAAYVFQLQEPQTVRVSFQKNEAGAVLQDRTMVSKVREGAAIPVSVVLTTSDGQALRSPVTVTVTSAPINAELGSDYGATGDLLKDKATVQFEAGSNPQSKPVPFSVLPDCLAEGEEAFTLSLSELPDTQKLQVRIQDVGAVDGIHVILPGPQPLVTAESGSEATLQVRLTCQPAGDVFLALISSDASEGKVTRPSPPTLKFTPDNWSAAQPVTVKGQNDSECDGDQDYEIEIGSASADPGYSGLTREVSFKNLDDDGDSCPDADATMSVCVEGDGTVVYTLVVENTGNVDLRRNGLEIFEKLPAEVTVVTASADKGVATLDYLDNEVAWNGFLPVRSKVTIKILASLEPDVAPGTDVSFDATYEYEGDSEPFRDVPCPSSPP